MSDKEKIINTNIEEIMSDNFGRYAKYIIQDRALPDIRDGLKPVQRRIIYAMNDLQLYYDKPHKKTARTVGEVIGKYHPHGDTSINDAIVRMSQDWKNNVPLVDMHGNNGSIDGDEAAAMRYTECRMSRFSQLMINDIKKNCVQFIDNFDGSEKEPTVLPTWLPNLLINGCSGIAAGYATEIPPFNPSEVINSLITRIDSPNCHIETILNEMPGPDFPTGGIILDQKNLLGLYETGRGKINIRAKVELKNAKTAYITEIPYGVNKAELIKEINSLAYDNKNLEISNVLDETDEKGISIAINLKNSKNLEFTKKFLFKSTELQTSFSANMVAIVNRKPQLLGILQILDAFIEHINDILTKTTTFDLQKASLRKEIVSGLIKAINDSDNIITLIRSATNKANAKELLISKKKFSEIQAEAVVNLKLYQLSNADVEEFKKELIELNSDIEKYGKILNDRKFRNEFIKAKLREFRKIFNQKRKTTFSDEESNIQVNIEQIVDDKECVVVATYDGYLKNVTKRVFNNAKVTDLKLKDKDLPSAIFDSNNRDKAIFVTNKGNYVSIPVYKINEQTWKENGTHINNIITLPGEEKIIFGFNYSNDSSKNNRTIVLATKSGKVKRVDINDLGVSKIIKSTCIMSIEENDELVSCDISDDNTLENVYAITKLGYGLSYPKEQVPLVGKNASGVKNLSLMENDEIVSTFFDSSIKDFIMLCGNEGIKKIKKSELALGKRISQPRAIMGNTKDFKYTLFNAFLFSNDDIAYYTAEGNINAFLKLSEINKENLSSKISSYKGKKINKMFYVDQLIQHEKIASDEEENLFN